MRRLRKYFQSLTILLLTVVLLYSLYVRKDLNVKPRHEIGLTKAELCNVQQIENSNKTEENHYFSEISNVLRNDVKELRYSINAVLNNKKLNDYEKLLYVQHQVNHQLGLAIADADVIDAKVAKKREKIVDKLASYVQKQIHAQQNPATCNRILKCRPRVSGFASVFHQIVGCMVIGHATKHTVVLHADSIAMYHTPFSKIFKPLSKTCDDKQDGVDIDIILKSMDPNNDIRPPVVPTYLLSDLGAQVSFPDVWWTAQFAKYVFRTTDDVTMSLISHENDIDMNRTIVGIHIRRGDKISAHEAIYHTIEEYMVHVENWFQQNNEKQLEKNVFVASDDPAAVVELRQKYPDYKFKEGNIYTERNERGLRGIVQDLNILSKCEYLVCTFSSNICRLAYELMETYRIDASNRYQSLDDSYYFMSQRTQIVTHSHAAENADELSLEVGDIVVIKGNHWDGFSLGYHKRTEKIGLYPSHKARYTINSAVIPIYV